MTVTSLHPRPSESDISAPNPDAATADAVVHVLRPRDDEAERRAFLAWHDVAGTPEGDRLRADLIERYRPLADALARRFGRRGEPLDDLRQVAAIGLIKAVDGFDPDRGFSFAGYATPTILGEVRRHFRDRGWSIRVPRALQERRADILSAMERLPQHLGHTPAEHEVADSLGLTSDEVREGLTAAQAYSSMSLFTPVSRGSEGVMLVDVVGDEDAGYDLVDARTCLGSAVRALPPRERRLLGLRFFDQKTQTEIAAEMGISQMHVSRLLTKCLCELRGQLTQEAG